MCEFLFDVGLNYVVIYQWCEQVSKQDGQYDVFWESWVDYMDQYGYYINQDIEVLVIGIGYGGGYWVGCYEYYVEGEIVYYQMLVCWDGKYWVGVRVDYVEQ